MTAGQRKTAIGISFCAAAILGGLLGAVAVEFMAVGRGDSSTISELAWILWAQQPWVIWLVSVLVAFTLGFFSGHFLSQSKRVYDEIREGEREADVKKAEVKRFFGKSGSA